ncbi:hypothetical protein ACFE04_012475 [Oxalis oulophora]
MGCTSSKLDDLPAVALCRERCNFLEIAMRERYAFAEAHIAYSHSLKDFGSSLHQFIHKATTNTMLPPPPLKKPPSAAGGEGDLIDSSNHHHQDLHSGHIQFNSDSDDDHADDDDDDDDDLHSHGHLSSHSSPLHDHHHLNGVTPSVVYQQRPTSPQTLHQVSGGYQYPYPPNSEYNNYGLRPPPHSGGASTSKPPPPPPSPPRVSTWDFLNPFETYEKYYPSYNTPSRDSKSVREEEGIPDLEDEVYHHHQHQYEVVKEVHGDQKFRGPGETSKTGAFRPGSRNPDDVAIELEVQFVRASESLSDISNLLEVGKLPYQRRHVSRMLHVVTPSLSVISSQPSTSKSAKPSSAGDQDSPATLLDNTEEELMMRSKTLSATLQKLYLWENKLYNEVKAEEKMRVIHDRKVIKLKRLDEKGAEAHKIDATRTLVRSLSTKIRIAIQVVDKISVTINQIRDNELWPQLNVLIQGLTKMWKSVFECNHIQCIAVKEARNLGSVGAGKMLSDAHLEATLQFERALLNWTFRFSSWVRAQKGYVRALNSWLLKCLFIEPEETVDGIAPFSPGRMGAPPVFVICHQWSQALDRISEKEVTDSMRIFAMTVFHHWEQDKHEMKQRMMVNKELERKVRNLDREDHKIQKEIQALDKQIVQSSGDGKVDSLSVTGNAVYQSDMSSSLQGSLQRIFEAMERFTGESVKAYEELLQRSEEEMAAPR